MNKPLQVLVVEDSQDDTELLINELERGDYKVVYERVETAEALQAALDRQEWDLVISDYRMPHFSGLDALNFVLKSGVDLPFLIVSGVIGEEQAVAAMKAGAHDYLMKGRLARLVPMVERELREAQVRRKQRQAETELKRLQQEQERQSKEQVRQLTEQINVIFNTAWNVIILVGTDGRIDIANPSVNRKFGYLPTELTNQPLSILVIPSQQEALENWIQQVVAKGHPQQKQVVGKNKEGKIFDMEVSLARVNDNTRHIVCVFHDVSHFKAVERMKDNFISMVSHELRSPVTSLSLIAESLQMFYDRYTDAQVRQKIGELNNQCQVLMELIESVLDISRLEAQKGQSSQITTVDMTATARNTLAELQFDIKNKSHTVVAALPDQPITLLGYQLDFVRIWRNLFSNAIKYTPSGGKISVRLAWVARENLASSHLSRQETIAEHLVNGRLYIIGQVEDNGHGIGAEDLPNLFQRFNRGWAHKSNIPGTGLGLALVRELLTLYDGDICVSSQLGQGSIFTFWLPVPPTVD